MLQDQVDTEVQKLLALKAKYKELTGEDLAGGGGGKKGKVGDGTVRQSAGKKEARREAKFLLSLMITIEVRADLGSGHKTAGIAD